MLIAPYVVFFASMLATAIVSTSLSICAANPEVDFSDQDLQDSALTKFFQYQHHHPLLCGSIACGTHPHYLDDRDDLQTLPIRIICFGFYVIICMSLSLLSVKSPSTPVPDVLISTAATVFLLIFGTQPDILSVLCFWKKPKSQRAVESHKLDLQREYDQESGVSEPKYRFPAPLRPGAF
ncbi:hypothetical protein NLJ89_g10149 [Agrocybe chaxingu]|uniref:Uncharacterized protein n=1 Tax=Agrocybe chaxingu TaxID=84603 RepID=A0A9W8MP72_9AGAR|nr:hypothetical protein NLJ89_g10149 [Agrocybe chaxingu]